MHLPSLTPAHNSLYMSRLEIEAPLWKALEAGENVIISGPRRSGKTSLLYKIRVDAENNPKRWGRHRKGRDGAILLFDAQEPQSAYALCSRLAKLLPEADRRPGMFLSRMQSGNDEALTRDLDEILRAFQDSKSDTLLLIDEVDLPLRYEAPDLWRHILNRLFETESLQLVVTTDALNLDDLGLHARASRTRQIVMTPWSKADIRALLNRYSEDLSLERDAIDAIATTLAPAWPIEVILTMRHLFEDGVPPADRISFLVRDDGLIEYSSDMLSRALDRLDRNETRTAMNLLSSIAQADAVDAATVDAETAGKSENLAKLLPVARALAHAGVIALRGRLIAAATPALLQAMHLFTGR